MLDNSDAQSPQKVEKPVSRRVVVNWLTRLLVAESVLRILDAFSKTSSLKSQKIVDVVNPPTQSASASPVETQTQPTQTSAAKSIPSATAEARSSPTAALDTPTPQTPTPENLANEQVVFEATPETLAKLYASGQAVAGFGTNIPDSIDENMGGVALAPRIAQDASGRSYFAFEIRKMDQQQVDPNLLDAISKKNDIPYYATAVTFPLNPDGFQRLTMEFTMTLPESNIGNTWFASWLVPNWKRLGSRTLGVLQAELARVKGEKTEADVFEGYVNYTDSQGNLVKTASSVDHNATLPHDPARFISFDDLRALVNSAPNEPLHITATIDYKNDVLTVLVNGQPFFESKNEGSNPRWRVKTESGTLINIPCDFIFDLVAGGHTWPGNPYSIGTDDAHAVGTMKVYSVKVSGLPW
jgi:hypothetical protein